MGYRIGEVSKLLDLPVETIRFYEKMKIITPQRQPESTYRVYETWDIFYLMECMRYRSFGVSLKDIADILYEKPVSYFIDQISRRQHTIDEQLRYYTLLEKKIDDYKHRLEALPYNVGCYWFESRPEYRYFTYVSRNEGENYGRIEEEALFTRWLSEIPFVEYTHHVSLQDVMEGKVDRDRWGLSVTAEDADMLALPVDERVKVLPAGLYLCTVLDLGNYGTLDLKRFTPLIAYMEAHNIDPAGDIIGTVLTRVHEKGRLRRFIQYRIAVNQ